MATQANNTQTEAPKRLGAAEARKRVTELEKLLDEKNELIKKYEEQPYCYLCGKHKPTREFYVSPDPNAKPGYSRVCKKCAYLIANPKDENGNYMEPTKASIMAALEYLDRPFINKLWDTSYFECHNGQRHAKRNIWTAYIKNVSSLDAYKNLRWKDGDNFKTNASIAHMDKALPSSEEEKLDAEKKSLQETLEIEYEKNKRDVIQAAGYDPFEHHPIEADKPLLYGSLNSMIDDECRNDGMKLRAVIQIVKAFNQIEKLNDQIDMLLADPSMATHNAAEIDKKTSTVQKLITSANALAKENGISVNNNNNKSKGANTLTGKMKALAEIGFEDAKINAFDIETCRGMQQVAELSEAARHKQLGYDENIAQEIKDIKVELVETLTKERDAAVESLRILLQENLELKDYLKSKGLVDDHFQATPS